MFEKRQVYLVKAPAGKSAAGALPVEIILAQLPDSGRIKRMGMGNRCV
jgi:hypothetical protein